MTGHLRRRVGLSFLFGILVVTVLAFVGDAPRVAGAARHFSWALVPAILALTLFNYVLRGLKWQYYLRLIDIPIGRGESAQIFACGLSMAMTPGKIGELLKAWLLRERSGTPMSLSTPVILAERLTDGVAMLLLALVGLLLFRQGWEVLLLVAVAAILIIAVLQSRRLSGRLLAALQHLPIFATRITGLHQFYESAYALFRPRPLIIALLIGVISWSGECVAFFLVLVGLGFHATPLLLIRAAFVLATSTLIGSVSLLPGGLGAAEVSGAALLSLVMRGAISGPQAIVATLLIRFCTLWFGVAVGLAAILIFGRRLGLWGTRVLFTTSARDR